MRKLYHKYQKKINYLIVGLWNTVFGYFAFVLLYYLFHYQIHYLFLFVIGNILGITNAYIGYKLFVFKTKGNYLKEYLRFYLVYGVALGVNLALLPLFVEVIKLSPVTAQGLILFITIIFSYIGHNRFSFKPAG